MTATETVKLLSTVPGAKDVMPTGCREEAMEKILQTGLLKQELDKSIEFQKAWKEGAKCLSQIPGGTKEHTAALSAFYHSDEDFKNMLSTEVEKVALNVSLYEDNFHFKSLYFLLMDSMMLQKPKECQTAYIFLKDGQTVPVQGATVRASSFFAAHLKLSDMEEPYDITLLKIHSCFFVNMKDYTCEKNNNEVLLSPAEYFTVEKVVTHDDYTEVVLKHSNVNTSQHCTMLSR